MFFCTQLPTDVPNNVLSQLGARIQHALRAFTPDDQKALTKTVRTYPKTDFYDLATDLTSLGIGEAIVTVLSERGAPTPVAWTRLRAPRSLMDTIGPDYIKAAAQASPLFLKYGQTVDRESAYEMLAAKMAPPPEDRAPTVPPPMPDRHRPAADARAGGEGRTGHAREDDGQPGVQERDALGRHGDRPGDHPQHLRHRSTEALGADIRQRRR